MALTAVASYGLKCSQFCVEDLEMRINAEAKSSVLTVKLAQVCGPHLHGPSVTPQPP